MYGKILTSEQAVNIMANVKAKAKTIVFTNGCFDLLHVGHVEYLVAAKELGQVLVVGVNSDASVARLKGAERPINKLQDRMALLAALQCVDFVIPFTEDTPFRLISEVVKPNMLVKGGDYRIEQIIGSKFVIASNGEVKVIPFKKGYSSTNLIKTIKKLKTNQENEG